MINSVVAIVMFLTIIKSITHLTIIMVIWPLSILLDNRDNLSWNTRRLNLSFGSLSCCCFLELWWHSSLWCLSFFGSGLLGSSLFLFLHAIIMIWSISIVIGLFGSILKAIAFFSIIVIVDVLTFSKRLGISLIIVLLVMLFVMMLLLSKRVFLICLILNCCLRLFFWS